jgi:hypothetical protein
MVPGFDGQPLGGPALIPLEQRFDERVLEYVDREILAKHDRNANKILDRDEWEGVAWGDDPRTDDKDGDYRLTREELAIRMVRRWGYGEKRPGAASVGGTFTVATANTGGSQRTREYAEALMRQYDANKSGTLEQDEWKQMRGDPGSGDRNGDGVLTVDELAQRFAGGDRRDSDRRGDRDERRRGDDERNADRKSYRATTARERLPKGIPDWFTRKDVNADGQVAMAEYGTSWSDSELAEFQKWDGNNDGYITPDECLPKTKTDRVAELSKAMTIQVRAAEEQARIVEYQARVAEEIGRQRMRERGERERERRSDDGERRSGRDE